MRKAPVYVCPYVACRIYAPQSIVARANTRYLIIHISGYGVTAYKLMLHCLNYDHKSYSIEILAKLHAVMFINYDTLFP